MVCAFIKCQILFKTSISNFKCWMQTLDVECENQTKFKTWMSNSDVGFWRRYNAVVFPPSCFISLGDNGGTTSGVIFSFSNTSVRLLSDSKIRGKSQNCMGFFVRSLVTIITKRTPKITILPPNITLVRPKIMKCSPVVGTTELDDLMFFKMEKV